MFFVARRPSACKASNACGAGAAELANQPQRGQGQAAERQRASGADGPARAARRLFVAAGAVRVAQAQGQFARTLIGVQAIVCKTCLARAGTSTAPSPWAAS